MRLRIIAPFLAIALLASGLSSAKDSPEPKRGWLPKLYRMCTSCNLHLGWRFRSRLVTQSSNDMGANVLLLSTAAYFLDSGWAVSGQVAVAWCDRI